MRSVLVGGLALLSTPASRGSASTEPVRNTGPTESVNEQEIGHAIYYPIATSAGDKSAVAPELLLRQFMDKHTAMDYPAAAEAALRLISVIPDRPEGHYNLACAMSRMRRIREACAALNDALAYGWRDATHLLMDPDLAAVRERPEFAAIIERLDRAIMDERIQPAPLRMAPWQQVAADLSELAPQLQTRHHVPGLSVSLVHDGSVVWSESFGVRDRRSSQALEPADLFRVRAPLQLVTLLACQNEHQRGRLMLPALMQDGAELQAALARQESDTRRADPNAPRVVLRPVGAGRPRLNLDSSPEDGQGPLAQDDPHASHSTAGGMESLLRTAVEMASAMNFRRYCEQQVFEALALADTTFDQRSMVDAVNVTGHSRLGSPMLVDAGEPSRLHSIYTTAADLATLMVQCMPVESANDLEPAETAAFSQGPLFIDLIDVLDDELPGGLDLAIDVAQTPAGRRVELADSSSGMGCLMRWYPQTRNGIVILYNSATGGEAAKRLAHAALGGD